MKSVRSCTLNCIENLRKPIILQHNQSVFLGRCAVTEIQDSLLSRKQVKLTANTETCVVKVIPMGTNPSGANGFSLVRNKEYSLHHKDRLELLLDQFIYEIVFDPPPLPTEDVQNNGERRKRKMENDEASNTEAKQRKCEKSHWQEIGDKKLLIYTSAGVESRQKIASYDMDGTIVVPKSGARFPKDAKDWKFAFPEVPAKLRELHSDNYKIVFITNQAGIGNGKTDVKQFKIKVENTITALDVPVQVFVATGKGMYRKPAPGMWNALEEENNDNIKIDMKKSFYCGDAAGRDKNWAPNKKKDHSKSDLLFALNIGLKFLTPEEHFLGARKASRKMPTFDPRKLKTDLVDSNDELCTDNTEVIVFVGCPGSGKSHVCSSILVPAGYVHVNRDTLGTWQKCAQALEAALMRKQKVVVDNTNPDKESRKRYAKIAEKYNVPCRCFVMQTSYDQARHNIVFRQIVDPKHQVITDMIVNSYKGKFQEPTLEEGFTEIVKVKCIPKFNNPEHEKLYQMFLLEK